MSNNLLNLINTIKPILPIKLDTNITVNNILTPVIDEFTQSAQAAIDPFKKLLTPLQLQADNFPFINKNKTYTSLGDLFNAKPNPLNDYANYTYHIRFSMSNEVQAYNNINKLSPNTDNLTKVIIAESGVTAGFNIQSLNITTKATSDGRSRGMWTNATYTMEILEPLGITLIDKLYNSARELGAINYVTCPYFLEVWYNGYDENGNIIANNLFYNLYRVIIRDINANSDNVGTRYVVTMINDNGYAELNTMATPPSNIIIPAATLGEFFDQLQVAWNTMSSNINADGIQRNNYKIEYPAEWRSWTLKNPDALKQNSRGTPMYAELNSNKTTVTISRGQSIEVVIEFILYLCQEAQLWMTGSDSPSPGAPSLKSHGLIRYITIYPQSEIVAATPHDPVTLDYIRNITYSLIPTETVKAYVDMETVKRASTPTVAENKLRYMISNNRLAKKYEYIYTGKNTEVIKFDFTINNLWKITQPNWLQSNSYDQYTVGPVAATESIGWQQIKQVLNRTKLNPSSLIQAVDNLSSILTIGTNLNINSLINGAQQIIPTINNVANLINNIPSTTADISKLLSNNTLFLNFNTGDITKSTVANLVNNTLPNTVSTQLQLSNVKYAEDLIRPSGTLVTPLVPVVGQFDTAPTQQQARQNTDQNKVVSNPDPNKYEPGTGIMGSILNNVFEPNKAFANIELIIRGDPWWVSKSNLIQNNIVKNIVGGSAVANTDTQSANFLGGDNEILLEFRTGVTINEDTGLGEFSNTGSDFFSGLYYVSNVVSNFNRGKFTQTLYCKKDVLFNTEVLATSGSPTTSRDRQDFTPMSVSTSRDRQDTALVPTASIGNNTVAPTVSRDRQ